MKIKLTESSLKQIIKESIENVLNDDDSFVIFTAQNVDNKEELMRKYYKKEILELWYFRYG